MSPEPEPEAASVPTSRVARTARFGGLVAGQGARWAGMRAANAFRSEDKADAAQAQRATATANELVARLGEMKGAAMKLGQVLSTIDFDLIPEGEREQFKEKLAELRPAREAEDGRIMRYVEGLGPEALTRTISYRRVSTPERFVQPLAPALLHLFNHQTHHRDRHDLTWPELTCPS